MKHTDLFVILFSIGMNIFLVIYIYQIIKYRPFSAIVTLNNNGIHYKSKVADYFLSWEKLSKVSTFGPGKFEVVIFTDKTINSDKYKNNHWKTSDSKMYIYNYCGVLEYIAMHWNGNIPYFEYHIKKKKRNRN